MKHKSGLRQLGHSVRDFLTVRRPARYLLYILVACWIWLGFALDQPLNQFLYGTALALIFVCIRWGPFIGYDMASRSRNRKHLHRQEKWEFLLVIGGLAVFAGLVTIRADLQAGVIVFVSLTILAVVYAVLAPVRPKPPSTGMQPPAKNLAAADAPSVRRRGKTQHHSLKETVEAIERDLSATVRAVAREELCVIHYGAFDIHSRHLVFWLCVKTDAEKQRLEADGMLMRELREILVRYDYPPEGRESVHIGFESQETVDRESGGNWWHHWK